MTPLLTSLRSSEVRAANSPVLPPGTRPCRPLSMRKSTWPRRAPSSTLPSAANGVETAARTPPSFLVMVRGSFDVGIRCGRRSIGRARWSPSYPNWRLSTRGRFYRLGSKSRRARDAAEPRGAKADDARVRGARTSDDADGDVAAVGVHVFEYRRWDPEHPSRACRPGCALGGDHVAELGHGDRGEADQLVGPQQQPLAGRGGVV